MFKVFFSWQSDLSNSKTRGFIRECIDEANDYAGEAEAIDAERDEATLGLTGSPNIVDAIFSKIEDCDYFVADVSLCYLYNGDKPDKKEKRSPNPNVMLELGYASKVLGWDRIRCLCNNEYGKDYPFDISHNRIIDYSTTKNRDAEKARIAKILFNDIRDLKRKLPKAKQGKAMHLIGSYDLEKKKVTNLLIPMEIGQQESYKLHNEELIQNAKQLVKEIEELTEKVYTQPKTGKCDIKQDGSMTMQAAAFLAAQSALDEPVVIKYEENTKKILNARFGIEVNDKFFFCGNLKRRKQFLSDEYCLVGTDEEKQKYEKIEELSSTLLQLLMREKYLSTFDGINYFPLAIQNLSDVEDSNIRVVIHVNTGTIIDPSESLICKELDGAQGMICREDDENSGIGLIDELFLLPEDGNIHGDYKGIIPHTQMPRIPVFRGLNAYYPEKDSLDYKGELEEYIAVSQGDYFEFEIKNLRPGECKWLSEGILIRPSDKGVKLLYQIFSKQTPGNITGELEYAKR